jgi:hypothetical protein
VDKGPSKPGNPDDKSKTSPVPEQPADTESKSNLEPEKRSAPELKPAQTEQPAQEEKAAAIPDSAQTDSIRDSAPKTQSTPVIETREYRPAPISPSPSRFGVLIKEEIKNLKLIQASHYDERCYKPASFDLRLGSEYVTPRKDGQFKVGRCGKNGMLTIEPFSTAIVSTYECVKLPNNVVGRFNLRIDHALDGLIVQMGTQVEPEYEGPLFALLHNISGQPRNLKFRDYDTRPFTIEFSYTSQPLPPDEERAAKKRVKSLRDFVSPNYARGGIDLVLKELERVSKSLEARKTILLTAGVLAVLIALVSILVPFMLSKFTYDKDYFPIVTADAIAAMKYGPNHSNNAEIVKEVLRELEARPSGLPFVSRDRFYVDRLEQLRARRDSIKKDSPSSAELKAIQKEIDEIIELLKK